MNIVFDNIIFSLQKAGGISVVWNEIIKRALNDSEINPVFIELPNRNCFRQSIEIPQKKIISMNSKLPASVQRYLSSGIENKWGIFHSSYYRTARSSNLVNITTIHDFTYEYYREGLAKYVHSRQKGKAVKKSAAIICVSQNTKKDLLKFYPQIDEQKIHVIYNGVCEDYRIIENNQHQIKLIHFGSKEYAIYVGDRSSRYKNFYLAANACKNTGTSLVVVGGGKLSKNESSFLNNSLGKDNYNHLSGIDNSILNILYNNALCLLYPSLYEGFGIPVIEAQKAGCPVIAVNNSSIPEVIGPVSTLLNEPTVGSISEMIQQLKHNSEFANNQIQIGLQNAERFTWDRCYRDTKKVYKEIYDKFY